VVILLRLYAEGMRDMHRSGIRLLNQTSSKPFGASPVKR
jgi:hypothetical protein